MKISEINPIKSDSLEIDCQRIYDCIISSQREFDDNSQFEIYLSQTLGEIETLLYSVNDIDLFPEMIDMIYRFKYRLRELEGQMKFIDDENITNSNDLTYILDEMSKFKRII
ncbi:MAG: hypothetical protein IJQ68_03285 [Methanobrevibacter sp.]|uniref:hypothetical protein n=1 Tax=Methanobrevibacter sp. TaxID=66852 RepID=UPI0025DB1B65|nr:hypothetical protein [Methanobrevibacter sp.]MBR0270999.1 hypothetical protein [Methanobrevibacter sp.]